jgi:signal transduction histidine kinase
VQKLWASLGSGSAVELVCRRLDGSRFFGSASVSPVIDDLEVVLGYSLSVRDVTQSKEAEIRVKEFYSMVSHELRTPLTSIRAVLGLMEANVIEPGSPEATELVSVARQSSDRLIRLINNILDLQKIELGKMDFKQTVLDANALMNTCVNENTKMAEELGVQVVAVAMTAPVALMADEDKTIQVLTNLLSNAIKFSDKGGTVTIRASVHNNMFLRFSVTDCGPGIAPEHADKLFGKFQQLDSSDSRKQEGSGLGLAICKAIVEGQKGEIWYHNEEVGCTFGFDLPLASSRHRAFCGQALSS